MFMVPAVVRKTFAEMETRTSIKRLHVHSETTAAYMADGYARASGKPGICMAQVIGALNLAAGLRDAWLAHSPVIAMTGGRDPKTKFRKVYQEIDDMPAFEPVTKFNATVDDVARFPDMVRQAFRVATTGTPGPVHLQIRGNEGPDSIRTAAEIEPLVEPQFARVPPFRPSPEEGSLKRALDIIQAAERPMIVAGGGVRVSGAQDEVVALAEALQIPVATSLNGKDTIPGVHPLSVGVVGSYSRESANRIGDAGGPRRLRRLRNGRDDHALLGRAENRHAAIQIDIEPENIGRNYPLAGRDQRRRQGHAGAHGRARRQSDCRQAQGMDRRVAGSRSEWRARYNDALGSAALPIRPERLCGELTRLMPDDAIVVVDTGHAGMWMGGMYDLTSPRQSYMRSAGHLGWAFPAGLGAKCAAPNRPVVTFTGDAGFWYHIAEIETAARWGINSVTVVNNNGGGNQSKRGFDRVYGGQQTEQARELWTFSKVELRSDRSEHGGDGHPSREAGRSRRRRWPRHFRRNVR